MQGRGGRPQGMATIEGIMQALQRPILFLQDVTQIDPTRVPLGDHVALFAGLLTHTRYRAFWADNAVQRDGSKFKAGRGAAVLVPLETAAIDEGFPKSLKKGGNVQIFTNIDVALVYLPQLDLYIASVYAHPKELRRRRFTALSEGLPRRKIIIGGDFNFEMRDMEDKMLNKMLEHGWSVIPPATPSTASKGLDGFFVRPGALRVPARGSATILECNVSDVSDHKPIAMAIVTQHKRVHKLKPAAPQWHKMTPRLDAKYNSAVKDAYDSGMSIEESLLHATQRVVPQSKQCWTRQPIQMYSRRFEHAIQNDGTWDLYQLVKPRRAAQPLYQPMYHPDTGALVTDKKEQAELLKDVVAEKYGNQVHLPRNYTDADIMLNNRQLELAEVQYAQSKVRNGVAKDKHGISGQMIKTLRLDTLHLIMEKQHKDMWRGTPSRTSVTARVTMLTKPGKDAAIMTDRRPVSVGDHSAAIIDRVVTVRLQTDRRFEGAVHRSQHALRRGVPCGLQVAALMALANHTNAEGTSKFTPAFRHPNNLPPPLDETFPYGPTPQLERNEGVKAFFVDLTDAYCKMPRDAVLNNLARAGLHEFIPYFKGINGQRFFFVQNGSERSSEAIVRSGLTQGGPSSPLAFCVGAYQLAESACVNMDLSTSFLDDTNGAKAGRDPYRIDPVIQRTLNGVGNELDRLQQRMSEKKCVAMNIHFATGAFKHLPGTDHFLLQGKELPVINHDGGAHGTVKHLGDTLDPLLDCGKHIDLCLEKAQKQLQQLLMFKGIYPAHVLRELVYAHVLSRLLYDVQFVYPRISSTQKRRYETVITASARLITGAIKTCRNELAMSMAGLPSFEHLVAKRIVKTDEKLIRLSSNFNRVTGEYNQQPFVFEQWRRGHTHDVAAMADIVLSETAPRSRLDPRAYTAFVLQAKKYDRSANRGPDFARQTMRRAPLLTSIPSGKATHPFTQIDISKLRFSSNPPGGLSADPPDGVDPDAHKDCKHQASYEKLRADTKKFGMSSMDIYADGSADLEGYRGSLAAYAMFIGDVENDSNDKLIPPQYEGVAPAGAASCSFSAEGTATRNALRRLVQLHRAGVITPGYMRFILDTKSFIDALSVGPLQQREWLETECYVEIAELVAAGFSFAFVFVFSHCGVLRNEYVDDMCNLENNERGRARVPPSPTLPTSPPCSANAREPAPMRMCDCVNARLRGLEHYPGAPVCPFGRTDRSGLPLPLRPDSSVDKAGLSRDEETLLYRVRTLACPKIGETLNDRPAKCCRLCDEQVMHRRFAVWHMIECQHPSATQCRQQHGLQHRRDLMERGKERAVLALVRLFSEPQQGNGSGDDEE